MLWLNSEELIGTTKYPTLYKRCRIHQCHWNRARLYVQKQKSRNNNNNNNNKGSRGMGEVAPLYGVDSALVLTNPGVQ